MANRIKIQLSQNPQPFSYINFLATATVSPPYFIQIARTFVPGVPANNYSVQIGGSVAQTTVNLFNQLELTATNENYYFTLEDNAIYLNLIAERDFDLSYGTNNFYTVHLETLVPPVPEVITPLVLNSFQIEIIDTYENERILIEELTNIGSPKLTYDSGDDIFEAFMSSTLEFNMLDLLAQDARFYHLFTGDENRYLVKLSNVDAEENTQLIWQGFILPDQYSEPYKNGVVPVNFTAIDMISTLKGKFLDPWMYYQKFTLPEFFSMAMQLTGLKQDFIVKPSIVSVLAQVQFKNIIVSLEPYVNGGKYTDVYKIVEDILVAQCLTMKSYRGFWYLEGITRKGELSGPAIKFTSDNSEYITLNVERTVIAPMQSAGSMNFRANTPFKIVNVSFNYDEQKNLFPDDVVERDSAFIGYVNDAYDVSTPTTTYFNSWIKVGAPMLSLISSNSRFAFKKNPPNLPLYSFNEPQSLANYFKPPHNPYLHPGRFYEFEYEVEVTVKYNSYIAVPYLTEALDEGKYDTLPLWQLLHNGQEIRSNRPSSTTNVLNQWDEKRFDSKMNYTLPQQQDGVMADGKFIFKIKREFSVGAEGFVEFRVLQPMSSPEFGANRMLSFEIAPKVLKISIVEGEKDENIKAVRDINFTQTASVDLGITTTVNAAVANSFSIGSRIGNQEMIIPVQGQQTMTFTQVFPPVNTLLMTAKRFEISTNVRNLVFNNDRAKSLYLEKANGKKIHFYSVYVKRQFIGNTHLYYLTDWQGRPFKPKDYVRLPAIETGDVLKLKLSDFSAENYSHREFWHVHGFPQWIESYPKTVANVYHAVRKEPSFNLESTLLALMLPDQLLNFYFAGQSRNFIPTRLELDLSNGITTVNLKESTLNQITDISYE